MTDNSPHLMRPIPDEVWVRFFAGQSGRFIGSKFENISLDILNRIFDRAWVRTKSSHDGNKDFILNFESGTYWAESKAYKVALSYHVISPTLFMALVGEPDTIVFISRSPFNKNAKPLLAKYEKKTGKKIICIDGPLLDNVIIRNPDILEKFFPGNIFHSLPLEPFLAGVGITTNLGNEVREDEAQYLVEREFFEVDLPNTELVIGVGETVRVNAVLVNQDPFQELDISVAFDLVQNTPLDKNIQIVGPSEMIGSHEFSVHLEPAQVRQISIFLKGIEHGEKLKLPNLIFRGAGHEIQRNLPPITISRLFRIGLIGKQHNQAWNDVLGAASSHAGRNRIFMVQGRSGTGKSRLLKEMSGSLAASGFDIHQLNKEFESPQKSDLLLRQLLASLNHLPFVQSIEGKSYPDLEGQIADIDTNDTALLTSIIYDENSKFRSDPTMVARALRKSLGERKSAVIIDNTQNFDDTTADALSSLVSLLINNSDNGRVILILTFNTDLAVLGSGAEAFRKRLEKLASSDEAEPTVTNQCLNELSGDDINNFLKQALAGPTGEPIDPTHYPITFATVREHIPPNPLHLWETLRYLRDKDVLNVRGGLLTIRDDDDSRLASILRGIPPNLTRLMKQRWDEVCEAAGRERKRSGEGPSGEDLMRCMRVAYILGTGSRNTYQQLGVSGSHLSHLVRVGLLNEEGFGRVGFFHQRIFYFFQNQFQSFPRAHAQELKKKFQALGIEQSHFEQFLILCDQAGVVGRALMKSSAEAFLRRGASHEYFKPFLEILSRQLTKREQRLEDWVLMTFIAACDCYQEKESLKAGTQQIRYFYKDKVIHFPPSELPPHAMVKFMHRYINASLSIGADDEALSTTEAILGEINLFKFLSTSEQNLAKARLLDRKLSIIKNFSRYEQALQLGQQALEVAQAQNHRELEIEVLADCAEVHFAKLTPKDRKEGFALYQKAVERFGDDGWNLPDPVPVRSFVNKYYLSVAMEDWNQAMKNATNGINFAHSVRNHFWNARLHLLKSTAMLCLFADGTLEFNEVLRQIHATQDFMNVYAANRYEWATHYLKGKLNLLHGATDSAATSFSMVIDIITKNLQRPEQLVRRYELLMDIAVTCRGQGLHLAQEDIWSRLKQSSVGSECMAVLIMPEDHFSLYQNDWRKRVFLTHAGRNGISLTLAKI